MGLPQLQMDPTLAHGAGTYYHLTKLTLENDIEVFLYAFGKTAMVASTSLFDRTSPGSSKDDAWTNAIDYGKLKEAIHNC